MKIIPSFISLCAIGFLLFLGQLLAPVLDEWSGEKEKKEKAKLNAKECASYTPVTINKRLYCQCSDNESQVPGKCNEKYKND